MSQLLRLLLFPFAIIYGSAIGLRNLLYDLRVIKQHSSPCVVISVGNLTTGGTGKTPHIHYLIKLLQKKYNLAVLSRGYGRKTKRYQEVNLESIPDATGDESLQTKIRYPDAHVFVDENRAKGIQRILNDHDNVNVILLDDAFQHRKVKPSLSILLTAYDELFTEDYILPMGNLRESRTGYKRADIIVVTKCPPAISFKRREEIINQIKPQKGQQVFFSFIQYADDLISLDGKEKKVLSSKVRSIALSAIARPDYFEKYISEKTDPLKVFRFKDHHHFTEDDLKKIALEIKKLELEGIIICTEKDAVKLRSHQELIDKLRSSIFVLPIEMQFVNSDNNSFDSAIFTFLKEFNHE